jgi:hypothetical protein
VQRVAQVEDDAILPDDAGARIPSPSSPMQAPTRSTSATTNSGKVVNDEDERYERVAETPVGAGVDGGRGGGG